MFAQLLSSCRNSRPVSTSPCQQVGIFHLRAVDHFSYIFFGLDLHIICAVVDVVPSKSPLFSSSILVYSFFWRSSNPSGCEVGALQTGLLSFHQAIQAVLGRSFAPPTWQRPRSRQGASGMLRMRNWKLGKSIRFYLPYRVWTGWCKSTRVLSLVSFWIFGWKLVWRFIFRWRSIQAQTPERPVAPFWGARRDGSHWHLQRKKESGQPLRGSVNNVLVSRNAGFDSIIFGFLPEDSKTERCGFLRLYDCFGNMKSRRAEG